MDHNDAILDFTFDTYTDGAKRYLVNNRDIHSSVNQNFKMTKLREQDEWSIHEVAVNRLEKSRRHTLYELIWITDVPAAFWLVPCEIR